MRKISTFQEFKNEAKLNQPLHGFVPKQQPYDTFISLPRKSKRDSSNPFMSTNILGREGKFLVIRFWGNYFTDEMAEKLVKTYTGEEDLKFHHYPNDYVVEIMVDGEVIAKLSNYRKDFTIETDKIIQNKNILMKDVFPEEYQEYLEEIEAKDI